SAVVTASESAGSTPSLKLCGRRVTGGRRKLALRGCSSSAGRVDDRWTRAAPVDADERTRTSTWSPRHGPEPCASTNSATSACGARRRYRTRLGLTEHRSGLHAKRRGVDLHRAPTTARKRHFAARPPA